MTRRNLAIDGAIAALVLGLTLSMLAARGLGTPDVATRALDSFGILLAVASAVPLAVRRLAPLGVYAAICTASLVMVGLGYGLDFPFGVVVAAYTAAAAYGGDPRPRWRRGVLAAVAAFVPLAVLANGVHGIRIEPILPGLAVWAMLLAGAWVAGDRTRLRRERIAELEQQALRREREIDRERRLAAAEERTRIARELHDSAGHAINVMLVQAGAARLLREQDPAASRQAIVTLERVARHTLAEIDQLVHALRSDGSETVPPDPAAIEDLVERHRAAGLGVEVDLQGPRRTLPRNLGWATDRILQEALTNAARHGGGSAQVAVYFGEDAVDITVTNPVAARRSDGGGHGIVGMQERAQILGGALEAGEEHGRFRLHARLPHADQRPTARAVSDRVTVPQQD